MMPLRFILAFIVLVVLITNKIDSEKVMYAAIAFCCPQIFRKEFETIIGIEARRVRIEAGPVSAVLLGYSFLFNW